MGREHQRIVYVHIIGLVLYACVLFVSMSISRINEKKKKNNYEIEIVFKKGKHSQTVESKVE